MMISQTTLMPHIMPVMSCIMAAVASVQQFDRRSLAGRRRMLGTISRLRLMVSTSKEFVLSWADRERGRCLRAAVGTKTSLSSITRHAEARYDPHLQPRLSRMGRGLRLFRDTPRPAPPPRRRDPDRRLELSSPPARQRRPRARPIQDPHQPKTPWAPRQSEEPTTTIPADCPPILIRPTREN